MPIPQLIDVPLESKADSTSGSKTKKLITAVSIEAPDLFRIRGVPCVDRGPDRLRLPVAFEHWRVDGSARREDFFATGAAVQPAKKTSNFARPSSVSEDTPNFFKVPGVAINRSSAITGVDAVCSPPPDHQPFSLPMTYMHGKEAQAVLHRAVLPGGWRETEGGTGQWGHATREFHELLTKMRREGDARGHQKGSSTPNSQSGQADLTNRPRTLKKTPAPGEYSTPPRRHHEPSRSSSSSSSSSAVAAAPRSGSKPPVSAAAGASTTPSRAPHTDSTGAVVSARGTAATRDRRRQGDGPDRTDEGGGGESKGQGVGNDRGSPPQQQQQQRQRQRQRRRRASAVEVFMSRLEGERGPRNRRESVAAYTRLLGDCQTNNSAQFRDDAAAATATATIATDASVAGGRAGLVGGNAVAAGSPAVAAAAAAAAAAMASEATEKSSALRGVLVRRDAAEKAVARLMGVAEGSYMLSPDADMAKVRLGREKLARTPSAPCGAVRVLAAADGRSARR